jgi:hypothetical protein
MASVIKGLENIDGPLFRAMSVLRLKEMQTLGLSLLCFQG